MNAPKKWMVTVNHEGLGKSRVIDGSNERLVQEKAKAQIAEWEHAWATKQAKISYRQERLAQAMARTQDAQGAIAELEALLSNIQPIVLPPVAPVPQPVYLPYPTPPSREAAREIALSQLSLLDRMFSERRKNQEEHEWARMMEVWLQEKRRIDAENTRQNNIFVLQSQRASRTQKMYAGYTAHEEKSVCGYFEAILKESRYPALLPRQWNIRYDANQKQLEMDCRLPVPADMPRLKEVKYSASRDDFREQLSSDRECNALYDTVIYSIALRTLHELFSADYAHALEWIVFQGVVHDLHRGYGHPATGCALSLRVDKSSMLAIHLSAVEPKTCFRSLKSRTHRALRGSFYHGNIPRVDDDSAINLAAMDWERFEHLVGEIFEKEFRPIGGEVRVTQASRDGGVDAVILNPDPLLGGKIIIQAKRYTRVVGLSAVRDLYGTVMNEGANKGILVTTAHFGPDSYEFIKGKPLTLVDGNDFLQLLEKHGHQAIIDIQAARPASKKGENDD
jgi:restriction system protein